MVSNDVHFYVTPNEYLRQGDIFRIEIVSPTPDLRQRIFRSNDGRHGSVVFEEKCPGRIFGREELSELLQQSHRTELHTEPFYPTHDGQEELVVVEARLYQYFIIASQTCDVSGKDGRGLPWTTIFPINTLAEHCRGTKLPFGSIGSMTIHEFICKNYQESAELEIANEADYGMAIRTIIDDWRKSGIKSELKSNVGRIKNILDDYCKEGYLYYLTDNVSYEIPEGSVDFTATYCIPRCNLEKIKHCRLARLNDEYCLELAQSLASLFERAATPKPMKPKIPQ
jgi:hypothetical protein